ncbi:MAG: amidohydrolase family protein [Actinobacteria bacterium]|nr:amidohydrolase family protein [Actinomycetota bacterium]MCA1719984.1 amidohydrolase family protein [Actinomycetota bacterium]
MTTTLWRGGRVRSPADPFATALLVDGDTVAWVGSEQAADALSADRTVRLEDAWVAPAFVDAHVHATSTGLALTGLDLTNAPSLAVALSRVEQAARAARGGAVLGTGWDDTRWPERRPPTAAELDRASYGGVVYLARTDVHSAVASSALLAAAPDARAQPGFLPDGLVRQEAHHVIRKAANAAVTPGQRRDAQRAMLDRAASLGIGCVHECGGPDIAGEDDFRDLLALEHGVRRIGYWGELGGTERARALGARGAGGDLFADGALGSHTACLTEAYEDADTTGHPYLTVEQVGRHVAACTRDGLQAGFHAIGDAALREVLEGYRAAAAEVGVEPIRALRHRVEHAEMLTSEQIATMAHLGLVASVQPAFDARWGGPDGMYVERLGAERARGMNPYAALAAAGVALALGSDAPVTPLDPWGTLRAAVRHRTAGSGLSARAAFAAHTRGGWRAAGIDDAGELAPGRPATLAVWQVEGELTVQTPDDRVAAWSTDPRAGVAGLPDLNGPEPRCTSTVVNGVTIFGG